jgi:hypothetical protein
MSLWIKFKNKFKEIINEIDEFKLIFDTYRNIEYNLLTIYYLEIFKYIYIYTLNKWNLKI